MNESSDKESAFGLSADQIGRLLSIGSGKDPVPAESPSSTDASGDKPALSAVEGSESSLQIDGYEIIEKVAEAGQGQVWRVLQQSTGRDVAIKVPKLGSVTSERARVRFEREVELAARLKHPNIARIYDSGVDRGQYYYVMDFVEGLNLNDYVMKHDLTHRQIFELMKTISQAVQHAHQNGVIHRDLKPSNIIVTDDGRPFIVDFGLAKGLLEDDRNLVVSMDGETVGTPAYMSPEQAAGHTDKVDTRTDVYSLGVTLFTLLTGSNPHDLSGSRLEVIHRIADEEVRRPRSLNRNIDKDIEALLLKALERDPDRRYSSAAGLTEDIDNFLRGEPLIAGSQSNVYRLKKFVKRNWLLVTGIAAVLTVLVAGVMVSTVFAVRAQRQAETSQAVVEFLTNDVLMSADPWVKGQELTLTEALDVASESLQGRFENEPLVEASIHHTLGATYRRVGKYEAAKPHAERAYQLRRERFGELHPDTLSSRASLALLYLRQGRYAEAEPMFRETLNGRMRVLGEKHLDTIASMYWLGVQYWYQGRYDEAQPLFAKVLEVRRHILGEDHLETLIALRSLASTYRCLGCYYEAEPLFNEALETSKRELGEEHPNALETMRGHVAMWIAQGLFEKAEPLAIKTLNIRRLVLGEEHPDTLESMTDLAVVYGKLGRYEQAVPLAHKALDTQSRVLGESHWWTLITMHSVAVLYMDQGNYEEAELWFKKVWTLRRQVLGEQHPHTLESMNGMAVLYKEQARYDEAEKLLLEAVEGRRLKLGDTHPHTLESWHNLIELYEAWNKPEKAEQLRAKLPQTEAVDK
jgi:tetratricopeptide (TPR) repeat protein/predicted Ser/Thr protein kinase